jgi:hypothetical protein
VKPIFQALTDVGNCATANDWFMEYESFYNSYRGWRNDQSTRRYSSCERTDAPTAAPETSAASTVTVAAIPLVIAMLLAIVAF